MNFRLQTYFAIFLCAQFAFAQVVPPGGQGRVGGHEYYVGTELGKPLITVNIMSGVRSPGVYHVPANTNMAELFSYGGGTLPTSDLKKVVVRRELNKESNLIKVYDFQSLVAANANLPSINDRDVIHIEQDPGLDNTLRWLSVASLATSILATIIVISDRD